MKNEENKTKGNLKMKENYIIYKNEKKGKIYARRLESLSSYSEEMITADIYKLKGDQEKYLEYVEKAKQLAKDFISSRDFMTFIEFRYIDNDDYIESNTIEITEGDIK
jgi:hypothetical protein